MSLDRYRVVMTQIFRTQWEVAVDWEDSHLCPLNSPGAILGALRCPLQREHSNQAQGIGMLTGMGWLALNKSYASA